VQALPQLPQLALSVFTSVQMAPAPVPHGFGVDAGQVQPLETQFWPPGHALPQPPQFWGSVAVLVQLPEQSCSPERQTALQALLTQLSPAGQAFPHPPQLAASFDVSVHSAPASEPQSVSPARQVVEQWPVPSQTCPEGQALPHAPQLFGSPLVFVQVPLHGFSPVGQLMAQCPSLQASPAPQIVPQPPQFAGSERKFTQAMPPSRVVQAEVDAGQAQAPAAPSSWGGQALPQTPQFCESEASWVQPPSQSVPLAAAQLAAALAAATHWPETQAFPAAQSAFDVHGAGVAE